MGMELGEAICTTDPWDGVDVLYLVLKMGLFQKIHPTGSREICNPHPMDTDFDVIALASEKCQQLGMEDLVAVLRVVGFSITEDLNYPLDQSAFVSCRHGKLNLLVTCDEGFYDKFVEATELAKERNLLHREDRVKLFQWILYNNKEG